MLEVPTTTGPVALVDDEDAWALDHRWRVTARKGNSTGYAATEIARVTVYLHRRVAETAGIVAPRDGWLVDHINRDRFDCRRENLRRANWSMNSANRTPASATGYLGVEEYRPGVFRAVIERDGKRTRKHGFLTAEAAAAWRDEYRIATFGY